MGNRRRIAFEVVLWVFALLLAWVFARQGIAKFSDDSGWARAFQVWHYPVWFRLLVGVAETTAALLLLTRRTAFAGALIIMVVMLGALGTHIWWASPGRSRARSFRSFWRPSWRWAGASPSFSGADGARGALA